MSLDDQRRYGDTSDAAGDAPGWHRVEDDSALSYQVGVTQSEITDDVVPRIEVVFIDTGIADYQTLLAGVDPDAEVVLLDGERDGVQQMAEYLDGRVGIDAVHVLSHGSTGQVHVGTATLSEATLDRYGDELATIGAALSADGDLLLYGCYVGADDRGAAFIDRVAAITGADVAASDDPTGHADLGGDWILEYATGTVEADIAMDAAAQESFLATLATFTFGASDSTTDNGATVTAMTDGVTVTVSNAFGNVDVFSGNGSGVGAGFTDFINDNNITASITFTFSSPVNVASIDIDFFSQSTPQENPLTLQATPSIGSPAPITITDLEPNAYTLNFSNITSFTIEDNGDGGGNQFLMAYDNLVFSAAADTTPPALQSFARQTPGTSPTNADTLVFRATFNEDVQNVDAADFAVNGTTTATVAGVSQVSASVYDITVSGGDLAGFNGTVGLNLAGGQNIQDTAGNALPAGEPGTDDTYTLDNSAPTLQSFTRQTPGTSPTNADTLVFRATFSEDVQNVDAGDFAVNGTTTATVTGVNQVSASVYDITLSGGNLAGLNGTVGLNLAGGQNITDLVGNALPAGEPGTDDTYTLENTAPTLQSFARQTPGTSPTNADTLVFRATFSEDVQNVDAADFAVNGTTTATVTGVNQVSASVYDITLSGGDLAGFTGTVGLNLAGGQNITDLVGNALPAGEPGTDDTYTLDNTAPTLQSFARQTPGTSPTNADTLVFRATFNEDVQNVDAADFAVNGTTTATVTGVNQVSASVYDITLSGGDLAGFTGTVGLNLAGGQNITDLVGNALPAGEPGTDDTYTVDNTAPALQSFARQTPGTSPTNADTLIFRATFSEDMQNVDAADFAVNGTTTATVTGVNQVSASVYDITVSGGDLAGFNGVVGLNLAGGQSIQDAAGNALPAGEPGTDETYTLDNTAPTVTSIARQTPATAVTSDASVTFLVTFDDTVSNISTDDFTLSTTDTVAGTVASVSTASGNSVQVTVNTITGDGNLGLNIAPGRDIQDAVGNILSATEPGTDEVYTIDNTAPTVTAITRTTPAGVDTNADSVVFTVTFSETVSNIDITDFTLNTGGTAAGVIASVSAAGGSSVQVTVNTVTGDGTLGLDIAGATNIQDAIGNPLTVAEPGTDQTYAIDNTTPTLSAVDLVAASDTGTSNTDDLTSDTTPTIAFTAENGATVAIDWGDGNSFVAAAAGTGGSQQATLGSAYTTDGAKMVTVRATDAAGNQTTQTLDITIDTSGPTPALSSVTAPTNLDPFTVTIDFGEVVTGFTTADITVGGPGGTVTALVDNGGGQYTATVDATADGTVTLDVAAGSAHDIAGNPSLAATQFSIVVDTTAPADPAVTDPTGNQGLDATSYVITGTAEAGALIRIINDDNGNGVLDAGETTLAGSQQLGGSATDYAITVPLSQGVANEFLVTATDAAGNTSNAVDVPTLTEVNPGGGGGSPPPPPAPPDDDGDDIPDEIEDEVPPLTEGGTAGDGNGDGTPDSEQGDVASVPIRDTDEVSQNPDARTIFATLVGGTLSDDQGGAPRPGGGVTIGIITQSDAPPPDERDGIEMPLGLIGFEAGSQVPDGEEDAGGIPFSLLIEKDPDAPEDEQINGFWKQTSSGSWVNLASAEYGGQVTEVGGKIRLDFVIEDNGPFDSNPAPGAISDPGAPGYREADPLPPCPYKPFQPDTDEDGVPDAREAAFGLDPTLKDNDVFGDSALFVHQLYRDLLWREGEAAGAAYWMAQLDDGAMSRAQITEAFFGSAEYQASAGLIGRFYVGALGRNADACGLDYWMAQAQAGRSMEQIAEAFLESQEFSDRYGSLEPGELVTTLYTSLLGRAPSESEAAQWSAAFAAGTEPGALLLDLAQRPQALTSQQDALWLSTLYLSTLDRDPDAQGFAWWQAQLAQGGEVLAAIDGFLASSEYQERFLPAPEALQAALDVLGQPAPQALGSDALLG